MKLYELAIEIKKKKELERQSRSSDYVAQNKFFTVKRKKNLIISEHKEEEESDNEDMNFIHKDHQDNN